MVLTFYFWVDVGCQAQNIHGIIWGEIFSGLEFLPDEPIGNGLVRRLPTTVGVARWTDVLEPWTPYVLVCGLHQVDGNLTLDVSARPQVGLLPIFCDVDGYPFRVAYTSTSSSPSTEATKGKKNWRCWIQASRYIFFFALAASWRHFLGVFDKYDLASVLTTHMSLTLLVPFWQRSRIRRLPFCFVASGVIFVG